MNASEIMNNIRALMDKHANKYMDDDGINTATHHKPRDQDRVYAKIPPETKELCLKMYREGMTAKQIIEVTGVKRGTIQGWASSQGITRRKYQKQT